MISQITLKNFKSIKSAKLKLGPFNLFIGTNASGKSNFLDSLRFLQGIGWGLTVSEILRGRPRTGTGSEWEGIRGGSEMAEYKEAGEQSAVAKPVSLELDFTVSLDDERWPTNYGIEINARRGYICEEWLASQYDTRESTNNANAPVLKARYEGMSGQGQKPDLEFAKHRPLLQQMVVQATVEPRGHAMSRAALDTLGSIRRLDPQPTVLRQYSMAPEVDRLGERGENFAALVQSIRKSKHEGAFLQWLRELRPEEIESIEILEGALKEPMFALKEKGRVFPAPVLSDGTLRFAAITAAFFQPDMPKLMTIEEIENGVNPARMRVLMELVRHRAGQKETQVIATTHSPLLLDWLTKDEWQYTFLCHRDAETGETKILPLTEIPRFMEVAKVGKVGELFSEGWLDFAL
jgi:energy-coupling factor transporter ATP-binding protein EcfA2